MVPRFSGGSESLEVTLKNSDAGDFTGGPAVKTARSAGGLGSLVRELDSTHHNEDSTCHS